MLQSEEKKRDQVNIKMLKGVCDRVRIVSAAAATTATTLSLSLQQVLNWTWSVQIKYYKSVDINTNTTNTPMCMSTSIMMMKKKRIRRVCKCISIYTSIDICLGVSIGLVLDFFGSFSLRLSISCSHSKSSYIKIYICAQFSYNGVWCCYCYAMSSLYQFLSI